MTPFLTPSETIAAQEACAQAWEESRLRNGVDRMKAIYRAFPHSVNTRSAKGGLRLLWIEEYNAFGVCDSGGFLTLLGDEEDSNPARIMQHLFLLLSMEAKSPGAVRELITGVPRPKLLEPSQVPKISEKKLTLGDLGL